MTRFHYYLRTRWEHEGKVFWGYFSSVAGLKARFEDPFTLDLLAFARVYAI